MGASCSGGAAECQSTRTFFEQQVWSAFMGSVCTKCHTAEGQAADRGAKFLLQTSSFPGFIDANLANLKEVSQIQNAGSGQSELLLKPLGQLNHGGGAVLTDGGPEIKALRELVNRLSKGDACTEPPNTTLQTVVVADAPSTLRRAALDLVARLPTAAEKDAVAAGGDAALDTTLDAMMKEDAFYARLREMFNDTLLTDRFTNYDGAAIDFTDEKLYPGIAPYRDSKAPQYNSAKRPIINFALAREPLDLIAYVVKNDKPFTDIVSSTYTVVNPFSAIAYGLDKKLTFKDPTNYNEFQEAQVTLGTGVAVPHSGVLSMPSFLNRWTTSPTNRNRGRARRVFQFFLATDVLKIAERPVDATKVTGAEDPTRNSSYCTVCHKIIDPVAGGFRGYDDYNYEDFDPKRPWHDEMFPPGFDNTDMDSSYYTKALQWLGPKVAGDPRFAVSTVRTIHKGMTGRDPLPYPTDSKDPAFATKLAAWEAQDAYFRQAVDAFTNGNFNVKLVFKAVIKSPYYRAVSAPNMPPGLLADVGAARMLTPEMLTRKITAVTGYHWRKGNDWKTQHDWLLEDYDILYGGIDSEATIARLTNPNGIISSVASRFANEMACSLTAFDFTRPKSGRSFFPKVELTEVPESSGHAVDGSVADIKANIQFLHEYLLDEKLDVSDPEIERTFQLFLDTWHELSQSGDTGLPYDCGGRWNPADGTDLDKSVQIGDDKNYTVRSWLAVMTYLLSDYKFLYE